MHSGELVDKKCRHHPKAAFNHAEFLMLRLGRVINEGIKISPCPPLAKGGWGDFKESF